MRAGALMSGRVPNGAANKRDGCTAARPFAIPRFRLERRFRKRPQRLEQRAHNSRCTRQNSHRQNRKRYERRGLARPR